MKMSLRTLVLITALVLSGGSMPAMADNTGYAFVFAYSHRLKEAYYSPIFTHPAEGTSLSDNEYRGDIKLTRQVEDAFSNYLRTKLQRNSALFNISARTGYKTQAYAIRQLEADKADLKIQGLAATLQSDFIFKP